MKSFRNVRKICLLTGRTHAFEEEKSFEYDRQSHSVNLSILRSFFVIFERRKRAADRYVISNTLVHPRPQVRVILSSRRAFPHIKDMHLYVRVINRRRERYVAFDSSQFPNTEEGGNRKTQSTANTK